jgi:hypothetical protein
LRTESRVLRVSPVSVVAWLEFWGGVWGVSASMVALYHRWGELDALFLIGAICAVAYFVAVGVAGFWLKKNRIRGWRLSKVLLATQVVQFTLPGLAYAAYVGGQVSVGVHGWTLDALLDLGSLFRLRLGSHPPYGFTVNLLALSALWVLAKNSGSESVLPGGGN